LERKPQDLAAKYVGGSPILEEAQLDLVDKGYDWYRMKSEKVGTILLDLSVLLERLI
jgi:hypothetical protein